ncbi:MAG: HEAT repeat domain-containing protein [Planctomycetes bacterium]|nr:HEAT repeat domain-containing protein [Planctomycetota bacterium]
MDDAKRPVLAMAHRVDLYEEHLEEASFLYEQRLGLLHDETVSWRDLHDFEERFEAHVDGLVGGGEVALAACRLRAVEGDFGERHAAMRVFCRTQQKDDALRGFGLGDPEDPAELPAISNAWKHDCPEAWISELGHEDPMRAFVLAEVAGFRRIVSAVPSLLSLLRHADLRVLAKAAWALGRIRLPEAKPLMRLIDHEDASVRSAVAVALLRSGDRNSLAHWRERAATDDAAFLPIALGGIAEDVERVRVLAADAELRPAGLRALGILGDPGSVPALLAALDDDDEEAAEAAGAALQLITGAGLRETVQVPEEVDDEELFDEELEARERGKGPLPPEYSTEVERPSRDAAAWGRWWDANASRFQNGQRYRHGAPCSAGRVLDGLLDGTAPPWVRACGADELVVRYGLDEPFEVDQLVVEQRTRLGQLSAAASEMRDQAPGAWTP